MTTDPYRDIAERYAEGTANEWERIEAERAEAEAKHLAKVEDLCDYCFQPYPSHSSWCRASKR